jgi:chitinase
MLSILLATVLTALPAGEGAPSGSGYQAEIVFGYYPAWRAATHPPASFDFSHLNRVGHSFAYPDTEGVLIFPDDIQDPALVTAAHAAGAKVSLVLGGWGGSAGFSPTCADPVKRARFVREIQKALAAMNYDGVDLDWEYPSSAADRANLLSLVAELRVALGARKEITLAVPATNWSGQWFSSSLVAHADRLHVMTYDFTGGWSSQSGHHSALYSDGCSTPITMQQALAYWRGRGVADDQLVLGVPFYGRSFNSSALCQPFTTSGDATYAELALLESSPQWEVKWSSAALVPFLEEVNGPGLWSYENASSVLEKGFYIRNQKLCGAMIWEITQDVHNGQHLLLPSLAAPLGH